jgi:hypothetical protein
MADAEEITRANPQGRLFEFCQRTKCGRPKLTVSKANDGHVVTMTLRVAGRPLESGEHWARTRVLAEQLASRALLRDYGFAVVNIEGPPHAPVFRMAGHAVRVTGERVDRIWARTTS